MTLTTIELIPSGGFFSIKSTTYGEIAFMKAKVGDYITRLYDGVFDDPTFGDGTVVRSLSKEEAVAMTEDNRKILGG